MKFNLTVQQLKEAERSVYSQGMQDGVLEAIFEQLEIKNGYYVEFGAGDGEHISNTANLRKNHGWTGLLMDAEPLSIIVNQETITKDNINRILKRYKAENIDYLSIDVDGNDAYIFQELTSTPKLISIEFNSKFKNDESYAIEYNPNHKWAGDDYYGASLLALKRIGERKGYTLIYTVAQFDAFFLRNDLIAEDYKVPTIDEIFPHPIKAHDVISNKKWVEII